MNRRRFVAGLGAAGAALAADAHFVEPRRLEVTRHALDPRPAPGSAPLTLAQVSDLHLHGVGALHHHLADELRRARPDVVVHTGDVIDLPGRLPVLDAFLALLPPIPSYAILGNWDHWSREPARAFAEVYARHGVRLLVNETAVHVHRGRRLAITGLDDLVAGRPDLQLAVRDAEPADARLLLAHCPEHRDRLAPEAAALSIGDTVLRPALDLASLDVRLMLSGHTHGGQVTVLGAAPILPRGSGRYLRGWYRDPGLPPLYVSRGIGCSMLPVRLGSVPELAIITISV